MRETAVLKTILTIVCLGLLAVCPAIAGPASEAGAAGGPAVAAKAFLSAGPQDSSPAGGAVFDTAPAETETASPASTGDVPSETRQGIDLAIKEKLDSFLEQKNADGKSTIRGNYSRAFHRIDDNTYTVSLHKQTVSGDNLLTERYLYTVEKEAGKDKWNITKEELQDSWDGMYRRDFEGTGFQAFDGFTFEREGMKVATGSGSLWKVTRRDLVESIYVAADSIEWTYTPPLEDDRPLYEMLKKEYSNETVFQPDYLRIDCDPESCENILKSSFSGLKAVSEAELVPALAKTRDDVLKDVRKARSETAFAGYFPLYETDNRYWRVELRKDGGDRRAAIEYDNFEGREVSFWSYGLFRTFPFWDKVYSYYAEDTRRSTTPAIDLERRQSGFARDYDLQALAGTVEMGIESSEHLSGDITFTLTTKRELSKILFAISRDSRESNEKKETKSPSMTVNSLLDGNGNDLTWVKLGSSVGLVIFPKPVPAGTKVVIRMDFENENSIYKINTSYSAVDRLGWLPFVRFGDKIDDFDLTVKVPAKYQCLGVGKLVSEEVKDGVRITRWKPDFKVDFPTVIYGDYISEKSKIPVVKSDGTNVDVWIHVDKEGMSDWEIPPKALPALADEAANALNLYAAIYGVEYPYSKLDLVNDPLGFLYGQAPASIVYLGSGGFKSKGTLGSFGGGGLTKFTKSLVAHETGHQWWGSLIGNENERNYWFVESLAELSSALFVENVHSKKEYLEHVADWRREILDSDLQTSVQDASDLWSGGFSGYRAAVYAKGPYAFYIMRSTWGDEKFFKFLKMLAQELQGKSIVTRDIQRVAEEAFGGNMEWFFDQWIRGVGIPEYTFQYESRATEDGKYLVKGAVDQKVVVGTKKEVLEGTYYTAVVPVTVTGVSGKEYQVKIKVEGASTPFAFKVGERPKNVEFNKEGESLAWDVVKK